MHYLMPRGLSMPHDSEEASARRLRLERCTKGLRGARPFNPLKEGECQTTPKTLSY